ncbi:glycosyltransferase family 61 protein [Roseicyclus marinus]|uniref:glycosyltransferase family 61 protein n=1 Tax=Roseicyclus marinus TaxID=2161673 RepID=UPI00240EE595|nr:glycosyltransferase family 61 protein [Roseicyclus marinus]MDG3042192.1 glycosyltransferase family 61 protein [Roseicyclus marinus]
MPTPEPHLDFDPDRPINWTPVVHRDVVMVPWGDNPPGGAKRAAGLFDAQNRFLPEGHCWRYPFDPITVEPVPPLAEGRIERLEGRWMFGGLFYGHFGHFLVETTSRLWATGMLDDLDGLVFYPKRLLTHERRMFRETMPFFELCGLTTLELRVPQKPVVIDELLTPPPGFGMGEMMAGRPDYRDWMRANMGRAIAPNGPEAIYVSRSRLPSKRGSILMEDRLEALLEAEGYTIIHPQEETLERQIEIWKAARRVIALDGSALHFGAMLLAEGTEVAILNRGPSQNIEDYILQFRAFAGIDPLRIDALTGYFHPADQRVVKREVMATLDFEAVGAALRRGGFIRSDAAWQNPTRDEILAAAAKEAPDGTLDWTEI